MRFPELLSYLVDSEKYRLVDLAASTGLHNTDLSKIVRGKRPCGAKSLGSVLSGLKPEHQTQAIIAWVSDQLAPEHQSLVHIVPAIEMVKQEVPDVRTIEGALTVLGEQAAINPAVRVVLTNMAVAFTTMPSAQASVADLGDVEGAG